MNYLLIIAIILTFAVWWIAIHFFGLYGALGCAVLGVLGTLYIEFKGLP